MSEILIEFDAAESPQQSNFPSDSKGFIQNSPDKVWGPINVSIIVSIVVIEPVF